MDRHEIRAKQVKEFMQSPKHLTPQECETALNVKGPFTEHYESQQVLRAKNFKAVQVIDRRTFATETAAKNYIDNALIEGNACSMVEIDRGYLVSVLRVVD